MSCAKHLTFLLLSAAACSAAEESPTASSVPPPCVDAVAVGNVVWQDTNYVPADDGAWLDPVPWEIRWKVQKVFAGGPLRERLTTMFDSHAGIGKQVPYVLMILQRIGKRWWLVAAESRIVRTRDGRYALPVFDPFSEGELKLLPWLPRDWRERLVPIQYDAARLDQFLPAVAADYSENEWVRIDGELVIARRGLLLNDLDALRTEKAGGGCLRGPPEYWPDELKTG